MKGSTSSLPSRIHGWELVLQNAGLSEGLQKGQGGGNEKDSLSDPGVTTLLRVVVLGLDARELPEFNKWQRMIRKKRKATAVRG